ncbi:hypothetical protein RND81_07G107100 [Saponaria officinalis]|uniref:VOC domain-containing protein n=1 Tax=Saponaria officinalis TaxID=3572 RepID=A0AAW1JM00_SAPOF
MREIAENNPLGLTSLNHISIICRSIEKSIDFYQDVLGFIPVRRPSSFDFHGAWLFNYKIGIHLIQSNDEKVVIMPPTRVINPRDNHISFQCESMEMVEMKLNEMKIKHVKNKVTENGASVDQLFFHDPDGLMIEICNCENIPVIPLKLSYIN